MSKMSLTRVLNEVKLVENKINQFYQKHQLWAVISKNGTIPNFQDAAQFSSEVERNKKSITDLITRRNRIKAALLKTNNTVTVTISGNTFTIAEAIDYKNFLSVERSFYTNVNNQIVTVMNNKARLDAQLDEQVKSMIEKQIQGQGKTDHAVITGLETSLRAMNEYKLEDPADIKGWVEENLSRIETFINEIDFSLSEVNAKTEIEID